MNQTVDFSFVAMEYWGLILNRTYTVFVTHDFICGAKVRGVLAAADSRSGTVPIQGDLHDPESYVKPEWLARYQGIDVTSKEFLAIDKANFQIRRDDIAHVAYHPKKKWGMGPFPHTGRMVLHLRSGKKRELIPLGDQDGYLIRGKLISQSGT